MDTGWIHLQDNFSMTYMEEVTQFHEKAKFHVNNLRKTRCPYKICMNTVWKSLDGVE